MIDFDRLLKLRIVVARYGEMDSARWWNTKGQLGRLGAIALMRGFPRTYAFAQARAVFAVAAHRCEQVFRPPDAMTLWHLPAAVEEEFDARWETWLDAATDWESFFASVRTVPNTTLVDWLLYLDLISEETRACLATLKRAAEGRAVPLPKREVSKGLLDLLAAGFSKGDVERLAVPYVSGTT